MRKALIFIMLMTSTALPCSLVFQKSVYSKHVGSRSALFRFERNGKIGFIDARGREVIPPRYVPGFFGEEDFFEGLSPAQSQEDLWGFIDERGEWAIPAQYWRVEFFSEGLAAVTGSVKANFPLSYIDKAGNSKIQLAGEVGTAGRFSEGLASITLKGYTSVGKTGYIDKTGWTVIPPQFAVGGDFHDGLARVVLDGKCYIMTEGYGRQPPPSVPSATSCGGISDSITMRCREGFIDKTGKLKLEFEGTRDFSEGLGAVSVKGKWGYIDPKGTLVIPPSYDETRAFSEGLAAVRQGEFWGYIDQRGTVVVPPRFTEADSFSDGVAKVQGGYIGRAGRQILPELKGSLFVGGLAHVSLGPDHYGYVDKNGKTVFEYRVISGVK